MKRIGIVPGQSFDFAALPAAVKKGLEGAPEAGQRLMLWNAAWRLAEGRDAEVEVATAKLWASDAAHRLAHTTVHVHGGVGIDLDGEAHRYFTSAKRFEFSFGSATEQALSIGKALAAEPV